jgi:hypothetical protein
MKVAGVFCLVSFICHLLRFMRIHHGAALRIIESQTGGVVVGIVICLLIGRQLGKPNSSPKKPA